MLSDGGPVLSLLVRNRRCAFEVVGLLVGGAPRGDGYNRRPRPSRIRSVAGLVAAATLLTACSAARNDYLRGDDIGKRLAVNGWVLPTTERTVSPQLAGETLPGRRLNIAAWRGHVIVVNIWGSWCAPCRKEAPDLARLARLTAPQGVRFLGIDIKDSRSSAIAFERTFGITYPSLFDPTGRAAQALGPVAVQAVPSTYVLDTEGRVAARFVGKTTFEPLRETIELVRTGRVTPRSTSPQPHPSS